MEKRLNKLLCTHDSTLFSQTVHPFTLQKSLQLRMHSGSWAVPDACLGGWTGCMRVRSVSDSILWYGRLMVRAVKGTTETG